MKSDKLADAIGMVGDDLIHEAHAKKNQKSSLWKRLSISVAAMLVLAIGICAINSGLPSPQDNAFQMKLYAAEYPNMPQYPMDFNSPTYSEEYSRWREYTTSTRNAYREGNYDLSHFLSTTITEFLADETGENIAYSPLNLYMALAMLAEITDGTCRQQILALLDVSSVDALRTQSNALWNAHYIDDGLSTCTLASALWLDDKYSFHSDTLATLADTYYASSYLGDSNSAAFQSEIRSWLNAQTGGLLEEEINSLNFPDDMLLSLTTSLCFQAQWTDSFDENSTEAAVFHTTNGDVTCDFMHSSLTGKYYWGDNFAATVKTVKTGGSMYIILPDEGFSTNDVLANPQFQELLLTPNSYANSKNLIVNLALPKFDISSSADYAKRLPQLGVTDVFAPDTANFTPLLIANEAATDAESYVSNIWHDVRVSIDEEGCSAASYTVIMAPGGAMPPDEEVDFTVNRPFLFVVTSNVGLPLFVGIVNTP